MEGAAEEQRERFGHDHVAQRELAETGELGRRGSCGPRLAKRVTVAGGRTMTATGVRRGQGTPGRVLSSTAKARTAPGDRGPRPDAVGSGRGSAGARPERVDCESPGRSRMSSPSCCASSPARARRPRSPIRRLRRLRGRRPGGAARRRGELAGRRGTGNRRVADYDDVAAADRDLARRRRADAAKTRMRSSPCRPRAPLPRPTTRCRCCSCAVTRSWPCRRRWR